MSAFASMTAQAYAKDEIPGNGTSGVYKLSRRKLMINSDKIRIETRDRFQSQVIVTTINLTRYLDYDIDYDLGTLTFREPINVRDRSFNPIYIVVEYESADPADKAATYGGRANFKPNKDVALGATLIHEGTVGATGNLQGVDATIQIDTNTKLRAEWASTQRDLAGLKASGSAWLAEIQHHQASWDAKAYLREQALGFGLGQQAGSEIGTRKVGADGRYKFSDSVQLQAKAYKQESLLTGAQNEVIEGRVDQKLSDQLNAYYGARSAQDKTSLGEFRSQQLIGGATYTMPDKRLSLNTAAEFAPGTAASPNSPDRLLLGADYKLTEKTRMFAEQEFARGEKLSANNSRVGLRTLPWVGGEVSTSLGNGAINDAERLYGNIGLVQRWQINPHWQTDVSVDRSHTLRNAGVPLTTGTPLAMGAPLAFGSPVGDYTTAAVGAVYQDLLWSGNGRVEVRNASIDRQRNLQLGMQRKLDEGRSLALGFVMRNTSTATGSTRDADLRGSFAYRPSDSKWVWFDRADYITQSKTSAAANLKGEKLVNNLNANYLYNRHTQIALQYGAKYVRDSIDGIDYKGYTDLVGFEVRHDLNKDWDVAVFGSMMRSVSAGVRDSSVGASVGYKVVDNMWLSVGYNARSLDDRDFSGATYGARGFFLSLRMKVDQDTFGLNKRSTTLLSNSRKQ